MNFSQPKQRLNRTKFVFACLGLSLLLVGCATNTLQKRIEERPAAYQSLSPEIKALVDQGRIKVGMSEDAVYLAWGKPAQVLQMEDEKGLATKWLYEGSYMEEYRYWTFRPVTPYGYDRYGRYSSPMRESYLERDYLPRDYVSAEVDFVNGVVTKWRMRPRPQ